MLPNQHTFIVTPDPKWFLKLLMVAVLLAISLTIGAHYAKARRNSIALTFAIALAAMLAGHYAARAFQSAWGLLVAEVATFVILYIGIRYMLVTSLIASVTVALVGWVAMVVLMAIVVMVWQDEYAFGVA